MYCDANPSSSQRNKYSKNTSRQSSNLFRKSLKTRHSLSSLSCLLASFSLLPSLLSPHHSWPLDQWKHNLHNLKSLSCFLASSLLQFSRCNICQLDKQKDFFHKSLSLISLLLLHSCHCCRIQSLLFPFLFLRIFPFSSSLLASSTRTWFTK